MTYKADVFIDAIRGSGGVISAVAERVGCSWNTAKKYIEDHPTVKAAYEDECEKITDLAQSVIVGNIQNARKLQKAANGAVIVDTKDAKWWLSKKREAEFGEAVDVTSGGEKLFDMDKWIQARKRRIESIEELEDKECGTQDT